MSTLGESRWFCLPEGSRRKKDARILGGPCARRAGDGFGRRSISERKPPNSSKSTSGSSKRPLESEGPNPPFLGRRHPERLPRSPSVRSNSPPLGAEALRLFSPSVRTI